MAGVVQQHRERMENDETYRKVAMTPPSTKRHHNSQERTDLGESYTETPSQDDAIAALAGDDLEQAVKNADIAGRSTMTADEKRAALRNAGYTPGG
jgi:hypothetical protein